MLEQVWRRFPQHFCLFAFCTPASEGLKESETKSATPQEKAYVSPPNLHGLAAVLQEARNSDARIVR